MRLITELTEEVNYLVEEKEGKKDVYIEGVFMQGGIKNRNGRVYPMETLQREVGRYLKEAVEKNRAYGELGHPQGPNINLDRVSHMIKSLKVEGNNIMGRAKLMDTPMGTIAKNLIAEGAGLGVSSRGMGSVKQTNEGVMEVQDDFHLATAADIVADPSAPDAFVRGVMENAEWVMNPDGSWQMMQMAEQIRKEIVATPSNRLTEESIKSFQRFLANLSQKR